MADDLNLRVWGLHLLQGRAGTTCANNSCMGFYTRLQQQ
ncbi:hypothetical protein BLL52_2225 [Rhodoferax antarcticus ANT.BR]|uniref:Uncharacterized protein n=1 Tax=Rhodoferax antarcticus ANT.BR TaxID=1111071 RepID=A0A1Q8YD72_9BURK|nr:hypothetical protein BLL52_2225 [Rhodoferax antarcticus ANT.BR]